MTKTLPQAFQSQMPSALPFKARQHPLQYPVAICFVLCFSVAVQPMVNNTGEYSTLSGPLRVQNPGRALEREGKERQQVLSQMHWHHL